MVLIVRLLNFVYCDYNFKMMMPKINVIAIKTGCNFSLQMVFCFFVFNYLALVCDIKFLVGYFSIGLGINKISESLYFGRVHTRYFSHKLCSLKTVLLMIVRFLSLFISLCLSVLGVFSGWAKIVQFKFQVEFKSFSLCIYFSFILFFLDPKT